MDKVTYWTIAFEGKSTEELSENHLQAVERIMHEPDILNINRITK